MRNEISKRKFKRRGLTLVELLIGSTIILMVILATLSLYMRSNRVSVDQQLDDNNGDTVIDKK